MATASGFGPGSRPRGRLIVVAGPSGVGTSTVVGKVLELDPEIWLSISATTRSPRVGEQPGREYVFLTPAEFASIDAESGFLESASFAGNHYGTPREPVVSRLAAGTDVLLEIDVQGVRQVVAALPEAMTAFIAPPSWDVLADRLTSRGTENDESLARRLAAAKDELAAASEFDVVIVNEDVQHAASELLAWVRSSRL